MEAIGRVNCQIAWLQPGHDPGGGDGVETTARERPVWALGHFGLNTRPQGRGEVTWAAMQSKAGQWREVTTRAIALRLRRRAFRARATPPWRTEGARAAGPGQCRP